MSKTFEIGDPVRVKNVVQEVENGVWSVIGVWDGYCTIKRRRPEVSKAHSVVIVRTVDELELASELWTPDDPWASHPEFELEEWRSEVRADNTRLGYIAWVNHQLHVRQEEGSQS